MKKFDLTITFTDRESYLAWRKQWAAEYAEISRTIRDLKLCRKTNPAALALREELSTKPDLQGPWGFNVWAALAHYHNAAVSHMLLLESAKAAANKQWEATHPELVEAAQKKRAQDTIEKEARIKAKIEKGRAERTARRLARKERTGCGAVS